MTRVGSIELLPVPDAVGVLAEYGEAYPKATADDWQPYRGLYADLFAGEAWRVPCTCFLIRSTDVTILVDTGIGPPGLADWAPEMEGRLPEALETLAVAPDDVDIVFLTHLHFDHLGWNTDRDGKPYFRRARYVVHRDALAFARTRSELPHIRRCVEPLADRFATISGNIDLVPGVRAFVAPGHYPGHMALRLSSQGREAVLLADIAVHPALLDRVDLPYAYDADSAVSIATRKAIVPTLVDRDILVACSHYPGSGIGHVVTQTDRVVWVEA